MFEHIGGDRMPSNYRAVRDRFNANWEKMKVNRNSIIWTVTIQIHSTFPSKFDNIFEFRMPLIHMKATQ